LALLLVLKQPDAQGQDLASLPRIQQQAGQLEAGASLQAAGQPAAL